MQNTIEFFIEKLMFLEIILLTASGGDISNEKIPEFFSFSLLFLKTLTA